MVDTPQATNALQHLMAMLMPQTMRSGTTDPIAQQANPQQMAGNGGMPVMNPQAWTQLGAGNFAPGASGKGGMMKSMGGSGGSGKGAGAGG